MEAPAHGLDGGLFWNSKAPILPALAHNVGRDGADQSTGVVFSKKGYSVDDFEARDYLGALALGDEWAPAAFQFAHASISVDADDQGIAQACGLFKAPQVADVEQVIATACEHDAATVSLKFSHTLSETFASQNFVTGFRHRSLLPPWDRG